VALQLLRLLTLTGARTLELRRLQWSEVEGLDGEAPLVRVPADRMKRRAAWVVPLSPASANVLRTVKRWQSEAGASLKGVKAGFVFVHLAGNYKGRVLSENAVNDLLQGMGWGESLTAHGLRKVFSTIAHDQWPYHGPNRTEAIEYSLAHAPADKVRGTYDKNDFTDKRRELLTWWAGHLEKVTAEAKKAAAAVVDVTVDEGFESAVQPMKLRRVK
jgi:integrase